MKKQFLLQIGIIVVAVLVTYGLMAYAPKIQDRKINLSVTQQETEIILKALGKLPLEESGDLFFNIQQQAITQLQQSQRPIIDSTAGKPKKKN